MMRKKIFIFIALLLMVFLTVNTALAQDVPKPEVKGTTADTAILVDAASGKILYGKNIHKRRPPASVTKIMTLLVAIEQIEKGRFKLRDKVTVSEHASEWGASQLYLEPGEEMTLKELLIGIAVASANDACVAVAEHIAGSHENFVDLMNKKAKELGLKDTHFANSHGLPADNHYTSAYDLSVIMREAVKHPLFLKITGIKEFSWRGGESKRYNHNKLLWWYKGADGGKTGWTTEAGYCLASTVEREGLRLIAVVMGTPEPRSHFRESMKIYNYYGFNKYRAVKLYNAKQKVSAVNVAKGMEDTVNVTADTPVRAIIEKYGNEKDITKEVKLPDYILAPVEKGQKLGVLTVKNKGKTLMKVDLVAAQDVPQGTVLRQIYKIYRGVFGFGKI